MALVGADGIWSAVRHHLFPEVQPRFSGLIAWRGTLDTTQLPREYTSRRVQLWMGPNAHLVAYPISGARQINVVAVVPGTWNRPGWSAPGEANDIKSAFVVGRMACRPRMLIGAVDEWRKWALFTVPDGGGWTDGATALLGDAAHAHAAVRRPRRRNGHRGRRRACQMPRGNPKPERTDHPRRAGALRPPAPATGRPRSTHRAAGRAHLSPRRSSRARARPRHQGNGRQAHAGPTGLDLRLAHVR